MGGEYGTPPQLGARSATGKLQPETLVHPYLDHVPRPTFQFTSSHIQNSLQQVAYHHSHHCPSAMATAPAEGASDPTLIEVTIEVVRFTGSIQGLTIRADHSQTGTWQ
jgi:hypothetical protein